MPCRLGQDRLFLFLEQQKEEKAGLLSVLLFLLLLDQQLVSAVSIVAVSIVVHDLFNANSRYEWY